MSFLSRSLCFVSRGGSSNFLHLSSQPAEPNHRSCEFLSWSPHCHLMKWWMRPSFSLTLPHSSTECVVEREAQACPSRENPDIKLAQGPMDQLSGWEIYNNQALRVYTESNTDRNPSKPVKDGHYTWLRFFSLQIFKRFSCRSFLTILSGHQIHRFRLGSCN